jgi:hypothetical protein
VNRQEENRIDLVDEPFELGECGLGVYGQPHL